jgi:hypothetical protein
MVVPYLCYGRKIPKASNKPQSVKLHVFFFSSENKRGVFHKVIPDYRFWHYYTYGAAWLSFHDAAWLSFHGAAWLSFHGAA